MLFAVLENKTGMCVGSRCLFSMQFTTCKAGGVVFTFLFLSQEQNFRVIIR